VNGLTPSCYNYLLDLIHFNRNLQLENELALAHSYVSREVHPLLAKPLTRQPRDDPDVHKGAKLPGTSRADDAGEVEHFESVAQVFFRYTFIYEFTKVCYRYCTR
jgi:hypothetical protein